MRIAVTGASGFLGQHVLTGLKTLDAEIVAVVRPQSVPSMDERGIEIVRMDLGDCGPNPLERMGAPETLIHLAWGGLPNYQSPHHMDIELPQQQAFLESCIRSGLKHLVVAGTCFEYGMQSGELDESLPTKPITEYGKAKDLLRRHLEILQDQCGYGLTWLRLFYLFGVGQGASSLYSQLRVAAQSGVVSFPMSPGDQIRDFLPAEVAGRCIAQLGSGGVDGGIVNLCSGTPVRVVDMARRWLCEWNATLQLQTGALPYPAYEPFSFWGSRSKLTSLMEHAK
jgi:dTDP-6-deoxy-L-talose 4-dehydrogenase (NAD+)